MSDTTILNELQEFLIDRGAAFVACADLRALPADVREDLPLGVCIGVALDRAVVAEIADGPTRVYETEYDRANALLDRLAEGGASLLKTKGFRAVPHIATVKVLDPESLATLLPHKTVATRAGVGWIGKCALLIHETYGSAVRYGTILTDAPLPVGAPIEASRCGDCKACVEACPAGAPSGRHWRPDLQREDFFDAQACWQCARTLAGKQGIDQSICGICIAACPYTKRYLNKSADAPT